MGILWNLMLLNSRKKEKDLLKTRKHIFIRIIKKKLSITDAEKSIILNKIADNNNNYSNIFRELYR